MRIHHLAPVFLLFLISSCSRPAFYQIENFDQHTKSHETIAILPFEVYTLGKLPKDITEEMLIEFENLESTALQAEFHSKILEARIKDERQLRIDLQHFSETNAILEENGIGIRESWTYSPEELAELLNVDAVLLARVEKEQNFSDELSAAIEVTQIILSIFTYEDFVDGTNKNKFLIGDYALVGHDGVVLWQLGDDKVLDWKYDTERCISRMNSRSAKYFPY